MFMLNRFTVCGNSSTEIKVFSDLNSTKIFKTWSFCQILLSRIFDQQSADIELYARWTHAVAKHLVSPWYKEAKTTFSILQAGSGLLSIYPCWRRLLITVNLRVYNKTPVILIEFTLLFCEVQQLVLDHVFKTPLTLQWILFIPDGTSFPKYSLT